MKDGDLGVAPALDDGPRHSVQFYEDDAYLVRTVASFLAAGLEANESVLIVATPEHRAAIIKRLGLLLSDASSLTRVVLADAEDTLARFMVGDVPDPELFWRVLDELAAQKNALSDASHVRAYGEMVDVLWRKGNAPGAIRLEELWGDGTRRHSLNLLCAYASRNFHAAGDAAHLLKICQAHDHVVPAEPALPHSSTWERLGDGSVLQQARTLEHEISRRQDLESALRLALHERAQIAEELQESLARENAARTRAEGSDAFKEIFLSILGRDLKSPLNTILTTARMLTVRSEVEPETQKRFHRIISSGLRMQRMMEQLLDITRVRLAGGIPVRRLPDQDLVALLAGVIDQLRAEFPTVPIEQHGPDVCLACVDPERFGEVVGNLVGNAIVHGDQSSTINVSLAVTEDMTSLSVQNCGPPIGDALMRILFNPFARGSQSSPGSGGLGLGLYISDQIVAAHGGSIEVESNTGGTLFEVCLPR